MRTHQRYQWPAWFPVVAALKNDQILGIVLVVLGILVLLGFLGGVIVLLAAIALIVYGILILMGKARGATWVGVLCLVLGILLLAPRIPVISDVLGALAGILVIVIGAILLIVGILKLIGKM